MGVSWFSCRERLPIFIWAGPYVPHDWWGDLCGRPGGRHIGLPLHVSLPIVRIVFVRMPIVGIVNDVFAGAVQFIVIADNMFVIIALPQFAGESRPPTLFDTMDVFIGGDRFECPRNIPQRRTCRGTGLVPALCPVPAPVSAPGAPTRGAPTSVNVPESVMMIIPCK